MLFQISGCIFSVQFSVFRVLPFSLFHSLSGFAENEEDRSLGHQDQEDADIGDKGVDEHHCICLEWPWMRTSTTS